MNQPNDKVKAQFFAQYYGQDIVKIKNSEELFTVSQLTFQYIEDVDYLLLRTVDQLTDEESLNIADLCGWIRSKNNLQNIQTGRDCIEEFLQDLHLSITAYQYLLRIGVLVRFTYLDENNQPVTIPEADLIKLGWCKIKEL